MKHLTAALALLVPLAAAAQPVDHYLWGLDASTVSDIWRHCPDQKVPPDLLEVISGMLQTSPLFAEGFRDGIILDEIDISRSGVGPWCDFWQGRYPHLFEPEVWG